MPERPPKPVAKSTLDERGSRNQKGASIIPRAFDIDALGENFDTLKKTWADKIYNITTRLSALEHEVANLPTDEAAQLNHLKKRCAALVSGLQLRLPRSSPFAGLEIGGGDLSAEQLAEIAAEFDAFAHTLDEIDFIVAETGIPSRDARTTNKYVAKKIPHPEPTPSERLTLKLQQTWHDLIFAKHFCTTCTRDTQNRTDELLARCYVAYQAQTGMEPTDMEEIISSATNTASLLDDDVPDKTDADVVAQLAVMSADLDVIEKSLRDSGRTVPAPHLPPPKVKMVTPSAPPAATTADLFAADAARVAAANARAGVADIADALRAQLGVTNVSTVAPESSAHNQARGRIRPENLDRMAPLETIILSDATSYAADNMPAYAEAARELHAKLGRMPADVRAYVQEQRNKGCDVFAMPGKQVQLDTLAIAIERLKPILCGDDGSCVPAKNTYNGWNHFQQLVAQRDALLVKDVPDEPYLSLMEPSERPPVESCNKTLVEQKAWVNKQKKTDPHISATNPAEYLVLENRSTKRTGNQPVDSRTLTRFVDLPLSADGLVLCGYFYPDTVDRQLEFKRVQRERLSDGGVRLSMRVTWP